MICKQAFCISTLIFFPSLLHLFLSFSFLLNAWMTSHLRISLFLDWHRAWSSPLRETLNFTFGLFLNSIPESPEARNLNWKTKIWCTCAFRGRPITANETLVKQIALKRFGSAKKGFGSIPASCYPLSTCTWCRLLQLHPLPSHFSPSTFIASAAQDKQQ